MSRTKIYVYETELLDIVEPDFHTIPGINPYYDPNSGMISMQLDITYVKVLLDALEQMNTNKDYSGLQNYLQYILTGETRVNRAEHD